MLKFLFSRRPLTKSLYHPPSLSPYSLLPNPYNESEFDESYKEYLKNLKEMSYSDLLNELKKYPGKPDSRTKYNILKFISTSLPKKPTIPKEKVYIPLMALKDVKNLALKSPIDNDEEFDDILIPLTNQSLYENELSDGPFQRYSSLFFSRSRNLKENLPFLENYAPNQILAETNKLTEANLRNEVIAVISRSNLFRNQIIEYRLKNMKRKEVKRVFYEIINLEAEHQRLTIDHLSHLMLQIKDNQIYNYTVNKVVKTLSDSFLCLNYISFFKGAPSNLIHLTWQTIVSLIECKLFHRILSWNLL